ncbi:hypothetical protein TWF173_004179 [Orbilia oligospora]|nr:hypothetical protein TWF173_004179 [Orbilia oligospora]
MSSESVDYYEVLGISPNATRDEIRKAYKMKALQTHPDRVPVNHPERPSRTRQFQLVNDAYYTLSDPTRRRDYDATRVHRRSSGPSYEREWQDEQFGEFFEEMMDQEGLRNEVREGTGKFWSLLGAIAGAIIGLGAIRDKKGKSVYEVFQEMPQNEKMRILSQLAARVLSGMTS